MTFTESNTVEQIKTKTDSVSETESVWPGRINHANRNSP